MNTQLSDRFLLLLWKNREPQYRIAQRARVDANTLSRKINGFDPIKALDPKIVSVGKVLGLTPEECFRSVEETAEPDATAAAEMVH